MFRKYSQTILTSFIINKILKSKLKGENFLGTTPKFENYTSDECSEISEQLVFS